MEPNEEHAQHDQNNYVDLVSESHDGIPQQAIFHVAQTQSQKKRRRFIPFKFHSKIFKASKKKRHVDDHRISTSSSSYASCRTFKKDSAKSNASSHTYLDIEECVHPSELERCNSISTESTVSCVAHRRTLETDLQGILKTSANDSAVTKNTQIQYHMELPKKTGRHAKKYMVIFCMILLCAIISAAIASVFSTKSLRENIPSDVENQLSNGKILPQALSNVIKEEVMVHIDGLQSEVHSFANETKLTNKNHFESLPSKRDFDVMKEENKENIYNIIHAIRCKTDCFNLADGDYQSCYTCEGFVKCSSGILVNQTCAPTPKNNELYWDDFKKQCLFNSSTCDPSYTSLTTNENQFVNDTHLKNM